MTVQKEAFSKERFSHPERLGIVTITFFKMWYPGECLDVHDTDKVRGDLSLQALSNARDLGHQVLVVDDSGEENEFHHALNDPPIQTQNEQNNQAMEDKRHAQYMNIITAYLHYTRYLIEQTEPTTRLRSRIRPL